MSDRRIEDLAAALRELATVDGESAAVTRIFCERAAGVLGAKAVSLWRLDGPLGRLEARGADPAGNPSPLEGVSEIADLASWVASGPGELDPSNAPSVLVDPAGGPMIALTVGSPASRVLAVGRAPGAAPFDAEDRAVASLLAMHAGLVVARLEARRDAADSERFFTGFNRMALDLHGRLDIVGARWAVCQHARRLLDADVGAVFVSEAEVVTRVVVEGLDPPESPGALRAWRASTSLAPVLLGAEAPAMREELVAALDRDPGSVGSVLVVSCDAEETGSADASWLVFARRDGHPTFSPRELARASLIVEQAALALRNARLHQQEHESRRIIQQQDRFHVLGELGGVVAHELKNALVPLRTLVELLPHRYDDPDFRKWYGETVLNEVKRMTGLVDQLGTMRQVSDRRPEPVDVGELLGDVVELLRPEARACGASIEFHREATPPVHAVPGELRQVFLNLLLNAIQAMSSRGTIEVGVRHAEERGGIAVWIEDQGPGVPEEDLDRIFEPLFTTKSQGTGLGLGVVKDLVRAFGGEVDVQNRPGGGARFSILIPTDATTSRRSPLH